GEQANSIIPAAAETQWSRNHHIAPVSINPGEADVSAGKPPKMLRQRIPVRAIDAGFESGGPPLDLGMISEFFRESGLTNCLPQQAVHPVRELLKERPLGLRRHGFT